MAALPRRLGDHSHETSNITAVIPLVVIDCKRADVVALEAAVKQWASRPRHSTRITLRRNAANGGAVAGGGSTTLRLRALLEDPQMAPHRSRLNIAGVGEVKYGVYDAEPKVGGGIAPLSSPTPQERQRRTGDGVEELLGMDREACPTEEKLEASSEFTQDEKTRRIMAELKVVEARKQLYKTTEAYEARLPEVHEQKQIEVYARGHASLWCIIRVIGRGYLWQNVSSSNPIPNSGRVVYPCRVSFASLSTLQKI